MKRRLLKAGLKQMVCELCGQTEIWHGKRISLILDHVNGVANDHRLENLRIVCPNCNASLETHCGRNQRRERPQRECPHCAGNYTPERKEQRFCSQTCANQQGNFTRRRVERPPFEQLLREIEQSSFLAVGRTYGVSDNAIRKWVRAYEAEARNGAASV